MSEYLTFQALCEKKKFTGPDDLIPYLKRGLQPYESFGGEAIYCPSEDHEYYTLNLRLQDITTTLQAIRDLRNVRRRLQEVSEVRKENFMGHIMFLLQELKASGYTLDLPIDFFQRDITFSKNNTAWMTDAFMDELSNQLKSLSQERKEIKKRQGEIKLVDPSRTSWEYFQEPNLDGYSFAASLFDDNCKLPERIWPNEKLEKLYEKLGNAYYMKKNIELAFGPYERHKAIKYAKRLWEEDKGLTIAEVARKIKRTLKIPQAEKTIHRWIADLAPDHKPGRRKGR